MKIQCACGTKVAFDVTPDMVHTPVKFICPNCGQDSSQLVNQLIAQQFATTGTASAPHIDIAPPPGRTAAPTLTTTAAAPAPEPVAPPPPAPAPPATPVQARIHVAAKPSTASEPASTGSQICAKHFGEKLIERCYVCKKPICRKCMQTFGYLCSAHCQNKAELQGIEVPEYEGKKTNVENREWRKVGMTIGAIAAALALMAGGWIWYEFFASRPGVKYAVRFEPGAQSGKCVMLPGNQLVFIHGSKLERHDYEQEKRIWSVELIDFPALKAKIELALSGKGDEDIVSFAQGLKIISVDNVFKELSESLTEDIELIVSGNDVWILSEDVLTKRDWETGKTVKEIKIASYRGMTPSGDELLAVTQDDKGNTDRVRINVKSGETRPEVIPTKEAPPVQVAAVTNRNRLDPQKVASQVPRMSPAQKLALPATLSVRRNQEQLMDELEEEEDDEEPGKRYVERITPDGKQRWEAISVIPSKNGDIQFGALMLEEKIVYRQAMKDPPKKSALNGDVNVTQTFEVANEILNEMTRNSGAGTVREDHSRYLVTINRPGVSQSAEWKGEVVGEPKLFALDTVTVLAAGTTVTVFDKFNKKLWESTLAYPIQKTYDEYAEVKDSTTGLGPCAERGETLYVYDQGVLSAFQLVSGEAKWRLPSVGIAGIFFDDEGMIYVNSTTATGDSIKYSKQIDVTDSVRSVILKVDPKDGKTLWTESPGGAIKYFSGKYIYTFDAHMQDASTTMSSEEGDNIYVVRNQPSFMRLRRINPKNGQVMWEHYQDRAPLDIHFDKNLIYAVFRKEVQVLTYMSF
jgi:hypothetical protein